MTARKENEKKREESRTPRPPSVDIVEDEGISEWRE